MNVKFITFYTEGEPRDKGGNLTKIIRSVKSLVEHHNCNFDVYSPFRLHQIGASELIKSFPDIYALPNNPSAHNFGLFAWKPFIILHAMSNMKEGEILFYLDANIGKYPSLRNMIQDMNLIIKNTLRYCDFYIGRELIEQHYKASEFCSTYQINEIGDNTDFIRNFPLLIANNIILRVSDFSYNIMLDWLSMCRVDKFILPPINKEEKHKHFRWFCADQSVINMIIARHIEEGLLPWFFPNIHYGRSNVLSIPNNDHIRFLNSANTDLHQKKKFREQFAQEINQTKNFLSSLQEGPIDDDWEILDLPLDSWKAVDDGHFKKHDSNYIFSDGSKHHFHLIRITDQKVNNSEIDIIIIAKKYKDTNPNIGLHVQQWGGVDLCTIYENGKKVLHPHVVFANVTPLSDDFYSYHIRFFNYHQTLSIGTGSPQGNYLGSDQELFEVKSIAVKKRNLKLL